MKNENEKKSFFDQLNERKKAKKSSCCGNYEIEEIPEEKNENENEKNGIFEQLNVSKKVKKSSCCGNYEIKEIPEENNENEPSKNKGNSCCR